MTIRAAKELINSSLWKEVEAEIDFRVNGLMQALMTCSTDELSETRIRILALKELKQIPETVIERDE